MIAQALLLWLAGLVTCFKVQSAGRFVASGDCKGGLKLWSLVEGVQLDMRDDAHLHACSVLAFLEPHVVCCSSVPAYADVVVGGVKVQ